MEGLRQYAADGALTVLKYALDAGVTILQYVVECPYEAGGCILLFVVVGILVTHGDQEHGKQS